MAGCGAGGFEARGEPAGATEQGPPHRGVAPPILRANAGPLARVPARWREDGYWLGQWVSVNGQNTGRERSLVTVAVGWKLSRMVLGRTQRER